MISQILAPRIAGYLSTSIYYTTLTFWQYIHLYNNICTAASIGTEVCTDTTAGLGYLEVN